MGKSIVSLPAIALFAFTLTFAGCGKKEEPAPPPPPPAAAPAPAEPAAPAGTQAAPGGDQKAPADQPPGGARWRRKTRELKPSKDDLNLLRFFGNRRRGRVFTLPLFCNSGRAGVALWRSKPT